jgi:hypothetical protein
MVFSAIYYTLLIALLWPYVANARPSPGSESVSGQLEALKQEPQPSAWEIFTGFYDSSTISDCYFFDFTPANRRKSGVDFWLGQWSKQHSHNGKFVNSTDRMDYEWNKFATDNFANRNFQCGILVETYYGMLSISDAIHLVKNSNGPIPKNPRAQARRILFVGQMMQLLHSQTRLQIVSGISIF